jgi:tryptophanyl-tRNA synthetase
MLREERASVEEKVRTMPTDPARVRRSDPGDPEKCPVWDWHLMYSNQRTRDWAADGCRSAGIGCLECKQPVLEAILAEQQPIRERAEEYAADPDTVHGIIDEGCEAARAAARETMEEVREAVGLAYR